MIKLGQVKIPGVEIPPEEMPQSMSAGLPPKPALNFLTFSKSKQNIGGMQLENLTVPQKYFQLYHDHPTFSTSFRPWYHESQEQVWLDVAGPTSKAQSKR